MRVPSVAARAAWRAVAASPKSAAWSGKHSKKSADGVDAGQDVAALVEHVDAEAGGTAAEAFAVALPASSSRDCLGRNPAASAATCKRVATADTWRTMSAADVVVAAAVAAAAARTQEERTVFPS